MRRAAACVVVVFGLAGCGTSQTQHHAATSAQREPLPKGRAEGFRCARAAAGKAACTIRWENGQTQQVTVMPFRAGEPPPRLLRRLVRAARGRALLSNR